MCMCFLINNFCFHHIVMTLARFRISGDFRDVLIFAFLQSFHATNIKCAKIILVIVCYKKLLELQKKRMTQKTTSFPHFCKFLCYAKNPNYLVLI